MVKAFELAAVSKSNAVFDLEKLAWMNSEYLRHLPAADLYALVEQELKSAGIWREEFAANERERFESGARLLQTRARTVHDFLQSGRAFFSDEFKYDPEAQKKFWKQPELAELLAQLGERHAQTDPFVVQETEKCLRALAEEKGVKADLLINASCVALTGQAVAPGLFEVKVTLGRESVVSRLQRAAAYLRKNSQI